MKLDTSVAFCQGEKGGGSLLFLASDFSHEFGARSQEQDRRCD